MEIERKPVDLVFVVGPMNKKTKRAVSRYSRRVSKLSNGFKVATIQFTDKYDQNLGNHVFLSRIIDFNATSPAKIGELPQVQGNPLQHVTKLSFRDNAVKICIFMSNTLPFHDSYYVDDARQQNNESNDQATEKSSSTAEQVYHEDPLLTCRRLAAMGVTMYCIEETNYCATFCRDLYSAFTYITGGEFLLLNKITSLQKILQNIIMEEISLETQVGQVRDYLCVAWHRWGRKKARVPANIEVLTDNILNHLHNTNTITYEVLVGGNAPEMPGEVAKEIAKLSEVNEARGLSAEKQNWSAELSWIAEEHDEVIPDYNEVPLHQQCTEVSVSKLKLVTRNQVSRMLMRVLTRRPKAKHLTDTPAPTTLNRRNENQDTKQSTNSSASNSSSDHTTDSSINDYKLLEETILKTKRDCKPHETIVINCQKIAFCSVA